MRPRRFSCSWPDLRRMSERSWNYRECPRRQKVWSLCLPTSCSRLADIHASERSRIRCARPYQTGPGNRGASRPVLALHGEDSVGSTRGPLDSALNGMWGPSGDLRDIERRRAFAPRFHLACHSPTVIFLSSALVAAAVPVRRGSSSMPLTLDRSSAKRSPGGMFASDNVRTPWDRCVPRLHFVSAARHLVRSLELAVLLRFYRVHYFLTIRCTEHADTCIRICQVRVRTK